MVTRGGLALAATAMIVGVGMAAHGLMRVPDADRPDDGAPAALARPAPDAMTPPVPLAAGGDLARPFSMHGLGAIDRARALDCLASAIYYEAASEPDDGKRAVAQVVLNRVRHPAFPATVCGVVYQGTGSGHCQFSFACDGAAARRTDTPAWTRAVRIAAAALAGDVFRPVGLATHYHTYAVTPGWNRTLVMTAAIGTHFFHRWKGAAGTVAAFTQGYAGGEPVPGAAMMASLPGRAADPVALPTVPPVVAISMPAPIVPADPADRLPPASTILDKWKDSGKPLG